MSDSHLLANETPKPDAKRSISPLPELDPQLEKHFRELIDDAVKFAMWLCGNKADAEDAVQQACYKCLQRASKLPLERLYFRGFLFKAIRRVLIDGFRRKAVRDKHHELMAMSLEARTETDQLYFDELAIIREAVDELPDEQRQVVQLRHYKDLDYSQIAVELEIPLGTVKSRLHHAIRKLKERLGPRLFEEYFNRL